MDQGKISPNLEHSQSRRQFLKMAGLVGTGPALVGPAVARGFRPMTAEEVTALAQRCQALVGDGHPELYKSTKKYAAAAGRSQHGYPGLKELPM